MKKTSVILIVLLNSFIFSQWNQTLNGTSIWSLASDLNGAFYAGSLGSSGTVYKSTNFGMNWSTLTSGNGQTIFDIAIDSSGRIFAANYANGLMISTNGGVNFTTIPVSVFGGHNLMAVCCGKNGFVFAGTNGGGLYRSTNFGVNWAPTTLTTQQIVTIAADRYNSSIIYAGAGATSGGLNGFYKSTDYGAAFSPNTNSGINVYGIIQLDSSTLVTASTSTGGPVHKSTNGGLNWSVVSSGYISRSALLYDYLSPQLIFLAGNGGIFYSSNGGSTFINAGITFSSTPLATYSNKIAAGLTGSSNGGVWFHEIPLSVEQTSELIPEKFSLSQNYPNPFNPSTTINFSIPQTPLSFGEGMEVTLYVFNSLGQKIASLVNQSLAPGTYSVEWNASNYSSGLYFCKIRAGDFYETKKMILLK
ncbi:MAG: T9SS type A sorting domain-containing protein [Ignavibacteria bacterium]|nr:T9SS type A sorting domain-containing protein [Ignavibacteria bacterium]